MNPEPFLQVADALPEATLLLSGDGTVLAANRAVFQCLAVAPDVLRGRRLADLVEDPPEKVAVYLDACARSREVVLGSVTLRRPGGQPVACRCEGARLSPAAGEEGPQILLRLVPEESASGPFVALNEKVEELAREVGRRRLAEETLRAQGEQLRITLVSIGDAVIVTDAAGRVVSLNVVAEALTGWGTEEAVGQTLEAVFAIVNETTRHTVESPVARVLREGVVVGLANHTVLIARNGVERSIDDSAAPIRDAGGAIAGVVLIFRDVTERRAAEHALRAADCRKDELLASLRASEEQFRTLADSIPQLAWITQSDGFIVWYNRRWYDYTGMTAEQMQGWGWQSVHDPAELPRVLTTWRTAIARGEPWEDTFPLRRHDGVMRWYLSRARPVRDEEGRIVRWFGTNTDITEHREMEEALRTADRRKDEFLATLAHELRNPLAPIRNSLEIMRRAGNDTAMAEQARAMMERQMRQMVRLVDDLLDVSRITRGLIELRKEKVELAAVLQNAIETSRPMLDAGRHQLTVALPPTPVSLDADPIRLAQVVANLLNNSAKYTEPGGHVRLTAAAEGGEAVVRVQDTGVGIPADMLPRVFEMFTQVRTADARAQGGLGIGLTIVKSLVEMHGGTVTARSTAPGQGSEFIVRLPLAPADPKPPAAPEPAAVGALSFPARRILVVDDSHDAAESLALLLRLMGQDVRVAHDGATALELARSFQPDTAFLDIGMPGMDGNELARRLRREPTQRGLRLIALTGWGQEEDRKLTKAAGFDRHLTKPVDIAVLQELVARAPVPS